jgi:predicted GH43/DUF377 family glycosyl hydrolase
MAIKKKAKKEKSKLKKKASSVVFKLSKNFRLKKIKKKKVYKKRKRTKVILKVKFSKPRKIYKRRKIVKKIKKKISQKINHQLERFRGNPIIFPANGMYFESRATFNPTAFEHDGKVHVIYRAVGESDVSTLGYAGSYDGYNLKERTFRPIFIHKNNLSEIETDKIQALYSSGGGWNGGAEDPRITKIDNILYMTYTAFDGWGSVRIGLTSIGLEDFINKKWNWKNPVLISPPGEIHKNWAIFPEKINSKYAIIHSISPEILIDYFKDLNSLDGKKYIKSNFNGKPNWDSGLKSVRGIGPAPIKTKLGWLIIYHAMEKNDPNRYKLFAMILDKKDPTKIIFHSKKAILEPDEFYENEGYKSGVIYCCGAVVKNDNLFIYYGGADMVSCVATANLELFLKDLKKTGTARLSKTKKPRT